MLEQLLQQQFPAFDLFRPALLGTAFNSMAAYLAQGRFDIDPAAIDFEAFVIGDRTISYFGIFCALLRLPLLGFPALDITRLSCLAALSLGLWFQLRAVALVRASMPPSPRRDFLIVAFVACLLLGGQQVQFLRASIYQEIVNWADALAMGFVFLAIQGLLRGFDRRGLTGMAVFAGLALLDRVSFGIGLYAALGLVLLWHWRLALLPALLLAAFVLAVGVVNQGRWGNPLVFADFTTYALNQDVTMDRLGRLAEFGTFNLRRIGLGLSYYFVPLWTIIRPDGALLFAEARFTLLDVMELPPSSFLLTDPLLLGLAVAGVRHASRLSLLVLAGLTIPGVLMLCAISMAYRYRMEFYPFFVLAALLGLRSSVTRVRPLIIAAVVVSIIASHTMAALYAVSPWGEAGQYVEPDGWVGTYAPRLRAGHD